MGFTTTVTDTPNPLPFSRWTAPIGAPSRRCTLRAWLRDYPILNVFTIPEVITLVRTVPFGTAAVVKALRDFPQFDSVAGCWNPLAIAFYVALTTLLIRCDTSSHSYSRRLPALG